MSHAAFVFWFWRWCSWFIVSFFFVLCQHTKRLLHQFVASMSHDAEAAQAFIDAALRQATWMGLLADRLAASSTSGLGATVAAQIKVACGVLRFVFAWVLTRRWCLGGCCVSLRRLCSRVSTRSGCLAHGLSLLERGAPTPAMKCLRS